MPGHLSIAASLLFSCLDRTNMEVTDWPVFHRETEASFPILPSDSDSSKAPDNSTRGLVKYEFDMDKIRSSYNLGDVVGVGGTIQHRRGYTFIKKWLIKLLKLPDKQVLVEKMMPVHRDPLPTSGRKHPDLHILIDGKVILVIEVLSGAKWSSTVVKLVRGLVHQLVYLRNHTSHTSVDGFYFPLNKVECVLRVTVSYDNTIMFRTTIEEIKKDEVSSVVKDVFERQKTIFSSFIGKPFRDCFSLPMSQEWIKNFFGDGSFQIASGKSVVIVDPEANKVYKHYLDVRPGFQFLQTETAHLEKIAAPVGLKHIPTSLMPLEFWSFRKYLSPLPRADLQGNTKLRVQFSITVVDAINELHGANLAHLDIRLENICFDPATNNAVLIDLDRAKHIAETYVYTTHRSIMYQPGEWNAGRVDWRQFGIMVGRIIFDLRTGEKYHQHLPKVASQFLTKLIKEGEIIIIEQSGVGAANFS